MYIELDGERVRAMREEVAYSAAAFAREVGIAPDSLRRAERGEPVAVTTARKIAAALGVEPPQSLASQAWTDARRRRLAQL